jgi:hypothetical protein
MDKALGQLTTPEAQDDLVEAFTALAGNRAFELLLLYDARLQISFQRSRRALIQLREKLPAAEPLEENAPAAQPETLRATTA